MTSISLPVSARACLLALAWSCMSSHAQTFPARAMRIVVPFPPGGTSDILARSIGQKLSEEWGQPVLTDNRPGAAGNIASENVADTAACDSAVYGFAYRGQNFSYGDACDRLRELSKSGRGLAPWHSRSCVVGKPVTRNDMMEA